MAGPRAERRGWAPYLPLSAVALVTVLAAGLRFFRIGNSSLWLDEGSTVSLRTASLDTVAGLNGG